MRWFWLACLTAGAVSDIRDRRVSCRLLVVCAAAGMLSAAGCGFPGAEPELTGGIAGTAARLTAAAAEYGAALAAGLAVLAVGRLTGGGIGAGDGLFLMASVWYLTAGEVWLLLLGGLAVSWVWSVGMVARGVRSGENMHGKTLPFLACMWPVGLWMTIGG